MKKQSVKSVAERLQAAEVKWICPVTGTKFDPMDTKAIEKHKKDLIAAEAARQHQSQITKKMTSLRRELDKAPTISKYKEVMLEMLQLKFPDRNLTASDLPELNVIRAKSKDVGSVLLVQNGPAGVLKEFRKMFNISQSLKFHSFPMELRDKWYITLTPSTPLGKRVAAHMDSTSRKKMTPEEKSELLQSNPEYAEKMRVLIAAASALSQQREKVAAMHQELENMRQKALVPEFFD